MELESANEFTREWIDAWNKGDLDRVLSHYTDDSQMNSPFIRMVYGEPSGKLAGKKKIRAYWQTMLAKFGPPQLEFLDLFASPNSIAIHYRNRNRRCVEVLFFNDEGLVTIAASHHVDEDSSKIG
ncbi:MAG TPA: nuclear transport factor 2 family protein [Verrucomicrobiae bacterium]|jgi:ketosteroid isomerase-like protein|nr:nuclear transport factor 2 family protein [Verrucomicrobiae bacterium]